MSIVQLTGEQKIRQGVISLYLSPYLKNALLSYKIHYQRLLSKSTFNSNVGAEIVKLFYDISFASFITAEQETPRQLFMYSSEWFLQRHIKQKKYTFDLTVSRGRSNSSVTYEEGDRVKKL